MVLANVDGEIGDTSEVIVIRGQWTGSAGVRADGEHLLGKFGDVLARVKNQTQTVLNTLDAAQTRTNQMNRALKKVEALPDAESQALLPGVAEGEDGADG